MQQKTKYQSLLTDYSSLSDVFHPVVILCLYNPLTYYVPVPVSPSLSISLSLSLSLSILQICDRQLHKAYTSCWSYNNAVHSAADEGAKRTDTCRGQCVLAILPPKSSIFFSFSTYCSLACIVSLLSIQ